MRGSSLTCALALAVLALAGAAGQASAADFDAYVACGLGRDAAPSHECAAGDKVGAFFRSNVGEVEYEVCVEFREGREVCSATQRARPGVLYVNKITTGPGRIDVTWTVDGVVVGPWATRISGSPSGPTRRTCGILPGDGAYFYVKTVGVRCRSGKRIALGANRKFCARHDKCRQSSPTGLYQGRVRYRGWACRVKNGYEYMQVRCVKGKRRILAESAA